MESVLLANQTYLIFVLNTSILLTRIFRMKPFIQVELPVAVGPVEEAHPAQTHLVLSNESQVIIDRSPNILWFHSHKSTELEFKRHEQFLTDFNSFFLGLS